MTAALPLHPKLYLGEELNSNFIFLEAEERTGNIRNIDD